MQKKNIVIGIAAVVLAFGAGASAGGNAHGDAAAAAPAPAPTVTVSAEPSPAVTVTAEPVVVEKAPPACIEALDLAGKAVTTMAEIPDLSSQAIQAAFNRDSAALESITSQVQALNDRISAQTPDLSKASTECRAAE